MESSDDWTAPDNYGVEVWRDGQDQELIMLCDGTTAVGTARNLGLYLGDGDREDPEAIYVRSTVHSASLTRCVWTDLRFWLDGVWTRQVNVITDGGVIVAAVRFPDLTGG